MPLVRVKQKFQVTLPVEVREQLDIGEGDLLEATVQDKSVVLTPKAVVDKKSLDMYLDERLAELRAGGNTVGSIATTGSSSSHRGTRTISSASRNTPSNDPPPRTTLLAPRQEDA